MHILIQNGLVIDPSSGESQVRDLFIADDRIQPQPSQLPAGTQIIDAKSYWVTPGFIDLHVHLRDPGLTHKETVETGSKAAAAGGYTTICAMPNTKPVTDCAEVVQYVINESKKSPYCHVLPIGAITIGQQGETLTDQRAMREAGACALSEDGKSVADADLMEQAMIRAKELNIPILDHCEEPALAKAGDSRAAENVMTAREIDLAERTGAQLHICHVSTKESAELVRRAQAKGLPITAEVCPHHFALDDRELAKGDSNYKMNPPLRSLEDVQAMKDAMADGTITCIATDHAPHADFEKGPMDKAMNGITGIEAALSLGVTELVEKGVLTPMQLIAYMSTNPAKVLGIDKGTLAEGAIADIAIVDPKEEYIFDMEKSFSKSKNAPYGGMKMTGQVKMTILGGKIVYKEGEILNV